jgi:hypothetical protein
MRQDDAPTEPPADLPAGTHRTVVLTRPQPLGVLPIPAGMLIFGDDPISAAVCQQLCAGRLPAQWPDQLEHVRLALTGQLQRAVESIVGDNIVADVNRFVLQPERSSYQQLREIASPLRELVEAIAFVVGIVDEPPSAHGLDREFAAFINLIRAAYHYDLGNIAAAIVELSDGAAAAMVDSPVLAGHLLATLAQTLHQRGGASAMVLCQYDDALRHFHGTDHHQTVGALWLHRALAAHELSSRQHDLLADAIEGYQRALGMFDRARQARESALARANLARAFHALPPTEPLHRLRAGLTIAATQPRDIADGTDREHEVPNEPAPSTEPGLLDAISRYEDLLARPGPGFGSPSEAARQRRRGDGIPATLNWARLLAEHRATLEHLQLGDEQQPRFLPIDVTFKTR